jgi:hypothetical protein
MKDRETGWVRLPLFIALSFCLGVYLEFWGRLPHFSILSHSYSWRPGPLAVAAFILFPLMMGLWAMSSGLQGFIFKEKYSRVMRRDVWTYLPALFFGLTPLALGHYLDRRDLGLRLSLLAVIVGGAVLYLKAVLGFRIHRAGGRPGTFPAKFGALPRRQRLTALFLVSLAVFSAGGLVLRSRGVYFSGDEPHYLLMDYSLLHDGDFDLKNNYEQKDYEKYMRPGVALRPHVIERGGNGPWYSFHSPGTAFALLPFYVLGDALGGGAVLVFFLRLGMAVFGALFGLELYLYARREWGREGLALGLWFLATASVPVFFYSFHVYPEIIVALLGLTLFRLIRHSESWPARRIAAAGVLFALIIWFHALKYLFLIAPLLAYFLWTLARRHRRRLELLYVLAGPVVLGGLYLWFQHSLYGSLSPSAISWRGAMSGSESMSYLKFLLAGIPLHFRWETLAGYFLDQRDGLLLYAPIYFFSFLGAVEMLMRKKSGFWTLAFVTGPYVLVSAFLTQRAGYAPQARPLVAVIWAGAILLGAFIAYNRKKIFTFLYGAAAIISLGVVALLLLNPLAIYQETTEGVVERGGALFNQLSNLHDHLRGILPSFIKVQGFWLPNYVWLGLTAFFVLLYVLWKRTEFRPRFGWHVGLALVLTGVLSFWFVYYPRDMLLNPVRVDLPDGGRLDFYSLSLSATMTQPARFNLRQDDRVYYFSFTTRQPIKELALRLGSTQGDYAAALTLFDHTFYKDRTRKEIETVTYPSPPAYRLGRVYYYRLDINLRKRSTVSTAENPYRLAIEPRW